MSSFSKAMKVLAPNAIWTAHDNVIVEWLSDDIDQPSAEDIASKVAEFDAQIPMEQLRDKRNKMLAETDWWGASDLTMTQAQTDYRQALRDITDNATSLDDVVWPTKPQVQTDGNDQPRRYAAWPTRCRWRMVG